MRALTILQPWALCILDFGKMVENRSWRPPDSLLGQRFAIHAGKVPDLPAYEGLLKEGYPLPLLSAMPFGAVVGVATLDRVVTALDDPWFCGPVGWRLRDVRGLPTPVPCRGAQGLWTLPPEVEAAVLKQVAGGAG